jgi:hypothetical protein
MLNVTDHDRKQGNRHAKTAVSGLAIISAVELAVIRQQVLSSFGDDDDESTDLSNMDRLYAVEDQLVRAGYYTDADKMAGLAILLEDSDGPVFADEFKVKLFARMRECAVS